MSNRKTKSKISPVSPIIRSQRCRFCQTSFKMGLRQLEYIQLNKKYLLTDIETGYCCKFQGFINGGFKVFPGGVKQFLKLYGFMKSLSQYYSLLEIKQKITQTIQSHAIEDQNKPIHFQEKFCRILMKNYQKNKDLKKRKIKHLKLSEDHCKQSTQVGDAALRTTKTPNMQILKKLKTTNQSMIELKKLTKNMDKMFQNFSSKGLLSDFNKQFDRKRIKSRDREKKLLKCLQKKISEKISVIKQNKSKEPKAEIKVQQDRYQLKKQKTRSNRKEHKRVSSQLISQKNVYDTKQPLTPAYQFVPPNQYFCGDKVSKTKQNKSKSNRNVLKRRSQSKRKSQQRSKKRIVIYTYHK